jgi:hypothetical protein
MTDSRIKLSHEYGEVVPNHYPDFAWAKEHEKELFKTYGRCCILVYQKEVIGVGATLNDAIEDAEQNLPPDSGVITPIMTTLYEKQPFFRVYPKPTNDSV